MAFYIIARDFRQVDLKNVLPKYVLSYQKVKPEGQTALTTAIQQLRMFSPSHLSPILVNLSTQTVLQLPVYEQKLKEEDPVQ